jgi:hypothetical protein
MARFNIGQHRASEKEVRKVEASLEVQGGVSEGEIEVAKEVRADQADVSESVVSGVEKARKEDGQEQPADVGDDDTGGGAEGEEEASRDQ